MKKKIIGIFIITLLIGSSYFQTIRGNDNSFNINIGNENSVDPLKHMTTEKETSSLKWEQTNGPRLEYIKDIEFDPDNYDILYIVSNTGSGILKSTDRGKSWNKMDNGIENFNVFSIEIDQKNHNIMYAGAAGDHLYKSIDKGKSWFLKNKNIEHKDMAIFSLKIHPEDTNIIFAGQGDYSMGGEQGGSLYKSIDGGDNWQEILFPGRMAFISSIEIDIKNPDIMYATTGYGDWCGGTHPGSPDSLSYGIYKSVNGGEAWDSVNKGLEDYTVGRITIDPRDSNILYAATGCVDDDLYDDSSVYRSINAGDSWQKIEGIFGPVNNVVFDNEYNVYASGYGGVYKSNDGIQWTKIDESIDGAIHTFMFDYVIDPRDSNHQYFGTYAGGIYESTDGGRNWHEVNGNINNGVILANSYGFNIDPYNQDILYAATIGGFFKTTDGGDNWNIVNHDLLNKEYRMMHHQRQVAVDPDSPNIVFALTDGGQIFKSLDYGESWSDISPYLDEFGVPYFQDVQYPDGIVVNHDLFVATRGNEEIFLLKYSNNKWSNIKEGLDNIINLFSIGHNSNGYYLGSNFGKIFYSDNGNSWDLLNPDKNFITFYDIVSTTIDGRLYAGSNGNGVYIYEPGWGWEPINLKYLTSTDRIEYIKVIAVDENNQDSLVVYDNSDSRIYKSVLKYVEEWNEYIIFWEEIFDLNKFDANDGVLSLAITGDLIFAGTRYNGLFISRDAGESWDNNIHPLILNQTIRYIKIDYENSNRIFIGYSGFESGIAKSEDAGITWASLNEDLSFTTIWGHSQLQIDPNNPEVVYAGTWGGGTYKTVDAGYTWTKLNDEHTFSPTCLAISNSNPDIIYACDRTEPVIHRSEDGGITWFDYYTFDDSNFMTNMITVDYNNPDKIYASSFRIPLAHSGDFVKIESGVAKKIGEDLPRSILDLEIDPKNDNILYLTTHIHGVYKSNNEGENWEQLDDKNNGLPRTGFYDIDIDPNDSNILYATASGGVLPDYMMTYIPFENLDPNAKAGVYKSWDAGETWTLILETVSEARGIAIDSRNSNALYVADMTGGIWVSSDGGQIWAKQNNGLGSLSMTSVAVKDSYIYSGTQGSGVYSGVIDSKYNIEWDIDRSNKPKAYVYDIRIDVDPINSDIIYVSGFPGGLLRSDDAGENWNDKNFLTPTLKVLNPEINGYYAFAINRQNPENVFIGVFGKGIFVSYDRGDYAIPLMNHGLDNKNIYDLCVDINGDYLYVSTDGQPSIYRLDLIDIENSEWEPLRVVNNSGSVVSDIEINPNDPDILFIASSPGGVFKSEDGGISWHEKTNGIAFGKFLDNGIGFDDGYYQLGMNPIDPNNLILGSYAGDIFVTFNGGDTWQKSMRGLVRIGSIYGFKFSSNGQIVYVSQKAGGVSKAEIYEFGDLECEGNFLWSSIKPGSILTGNIYIKNVGASGSNLSWRVCEEPNWGTWTFTPNYGQNLKPEDGKQIISVSVVVPNEKNHQFIDQIKLCNEEDEADNCTIQVSLATSKNKPYINTPFLNFLQDHPNMLTLLRQILNLQ